MDGRKNVEDVAAPHLNSINDHDEGLFHAVQRLQAHARERISLNPGWKFKRFTESPGDFNDASWESLDLPHDWAVKGPFLTEKDSIITGGEGRPPTHGDGWYRRSFTATTEDVSSKSLYLDINGAMAYDMACLNGNLVGRWPYGYASFRLDLTPFVKTGTNSIAIRVDNAVSSSRFYSGVGIYRNVWLTKAAKTHIVDDGAYITSKVSSKSAALDLMAHVEKSAASGKEQVEITTDVYVLNNSTGRLSEKVGQFPHTKVDVATGAQQSINLTLVLQNPRLWGPRPLQEPNLYVAVTRLQSRNGKKMDEYESRFGIRTRIYIQGVNQHHDFGSLGAAFNLRAAEQLFGMLQDLGCNSVRTSLNLLARELLGLADELGILILDEIFDTWQGAKVLNNFSLIFNECYGNEVVEQRTGDVGANVSMKIKNILCEEDLTRLRTLGANNAGPEDVFTTSMDIIGLNYQGEGRGKVGPLFRVFHEKFPDTMTVSSESSSAVSSRGTYLFPVTPENSTNVSAEGFDDANMYVSAYDLYAVPWGTSPDKVFVAQDPHPYVAGEYVWTGWDYLGEPTPFNLARSSYLGFIDLAGFPKDRFYLYQSRWNSTLKMAHICRTGTADSAELFANGVSQGMQKKKDKFTYRFRWDQVTYAPGKLHVVTTKDGAPWATPPIAVTDATGDVVPLANNAISSVSGPAEIVSTDNGDPTDMVPFPSKDRKVFNGMVLVVVRVKAGASGTITVTAKAEGLKGAKVKLKVE
ncbi:hypothetical protein B0H63DRAFT_455051 [Podospora didyma]|uniref:Beta-galactosidase n=1 Tax=Podospora didyma TaxID=330526 RepID=A0AAE0N2A1_9PEZI|nr:hypothetical protein B0H63DRAFT_455051 [Podospora didyma]